MTLNANTAANLHPGKFAGKYKISEDKLDTAKMTLHEIGLNRKESMRWMREVIDAVIKSYGIVLNKKDIKIKIVGNVAFKPRASAAISHKDRQPPYNIIVTKRTLRSKIDFLIFMLAHEAGHIVDFREMIGVSGIDKNLPKSNGFAHNLRSNGLVNGLRLMREAKYREYQLSQREVRANAVAMIFCAQINWTGMGLWSLSEMAGYKDDWEEFKEIVEELARQKGFQVPW